MAISDLTRKIVSKYLYGTEEKPVYIITNEVIRPTNVITTQDVQIHDYMSGPGRFARASMSSLVDRFFRPHMYEVNGQPLPALSPGTYSKEQLGIIYSNNYYGIDITQWQYSDEIDDMAERTFVWNSSSLQLTAVDFIVETDGTRWIDNMSIIPRPDVENFDLVTHEDDWIASLGNQFIIKPKMDTFGIGRRVNINFTGSPAPGSTYTQDDFEEDRLLAEAQYSILPPAGLLAGINGILDELWNEGVTQFLGPDDMPIVYGTSSNDTIDASDATDNPYMATLLIEDPALGVFLISGPGTDQLEGGDNDDVLSGGAGADTIDGGDGWNLVDYTDSEDGVEVDLSQTLQIGGDANGDSLSNISGVLGSDENDVLLGSGDGIYLRGGGGDDYIAVEGNLAQARDGGGIDTIVASGGRVFAFLDNDAEADTVIAGQQTSVPFGAASDRIVVRLSDLRIAAWVIENGSVPTEGQFAVDESRAIVIRGGVRDESLNSSIYYARSSLIYGQPQSQISWTENDWDGDHPPINLEITSVIQPAGWLRMMVCLMPSSPYDLESPLAQMMAGLGYSLLKAYNPAQDTTSVLGFIVADISIDEFGEGQFGINLYESGSAAAFSHIWNDGNYVSVPVGPPTLS